MAEKKVAHIHKFKRLTYKSGNSIFFCALPDCAQKLSTALALGKRSLCWRCGEPFIMNEYSLRLAKPHCESCHKPKKIEFENDSTISLTGNSEDKYIGEELSLAARLEQTIQQAQKNEEEEI